MVFRRSGRSLTSACANGKCLRRQVLEQTNEGGSQPILRVGIRDIRQEEQDVQGAKAGIDSCGHLGCHSKDSMAASISARTAGNFG